MMSTKRKLDDQQIRRIKALRESGVTLQELATAYSVAVNTIEVAIRRDLDVKLSDFILEPS